MSHPQKQNLGIVDSQAGFPGELFMFVVPSSPQETRWLCRTAQDVNYLNDFHQILQCPFVRCSKAERDLFHLFSWSGSVCSGTQRERDYLLRHSGEGGVVWILVTNHLSFLL